MYVNVCTYNTHARNTEKRIYIATHIPFGVNASEGCFNNAFTALNGSFWALSVVVVVVIVCVFDSPFSLLVFCSCNAFCACVCASCICFVYLSCSAEQTGSGRVINSSAILNVIKPLFVYAGLCICSPDLINAYVLFVFVSVLLSLLSLLLFLSLIYIIHICLKEPIYLGVHSGLQLQHTNNNGNA